jgi:hypothetical protein
MVRRLKLLKNTLENNSDGAATSGGMFFRATAQICARGGVRTARKCAAPAGIRARLRILR